MNRLKNEPPISNENILKNNHFANCSIEEIKVLWDNLRNYYSNGYIAENSPLKSFQIQYLQEYEHGIGLIVMEKHLLTVMAVKYVEVLK